MYNIFLIYIDEAHAADQWNIGLSAGAINQKHKTIDDRIDCAKKFIKEFQIDLPVYCDNMKNEFETLFAAWPTRYFVIKNNVLQMISDPENSQIDICKLFEFLANDK
jgi:hypothetical protein